VVEPRRLELLGKLVDDAGGRVAEEGHLPRVRLGAQVALEAVLVAALLGAHLAVPAEALEALLLLAVGDLRVFFCGGAKREEEEVGEVEKGEEERRRRTRRMDGRSILRRLSVSLSLSSFIAYRLGTRGVSLAHGCCCYNEERRELEETGVERE